MDDGKFISGMKNLKQAFMRGNRFVVFAGAGLNGGHNVHLLWDSLVKEVSRISFSNILHEAGESEDDIKAIMEAMGIQDSVKADSGLVRFVNNHFPVEVRVSMIKNLMKDHYIPALQQRLYSECNRSILKKSFSRFYAGTDHSTSAFSHWDDIEKEEKDSDGNLKELYTLFTVARMILLNPQIESVITYNFDNFIRQAVAVLVESPDDYFDEKEISFLKRRFGIFSKPDTPLSESVRVVDIHDNKVDSPGNVKTGIIPVYHVHGYIPDPREEEIAESPDIVMALEEFVEQQTDGLSWQDAVQIKAFRDSDILFIGCSMTDLTMKRMINFAHSCGNKTDVFILDSTNTKTGESATEEEIRRFRREGILNNLRRHYFESLGATFIFCPGGFDRLCDSLHDISYPYMREGQS